MNGRFVQAQVQALSELTAPLDNAEEDPAIPSIGAGDSGRSPIAAPASLPVALGTPGGASSSSSMLELGTPLRDPAVPISRSQTLSPPDPAPSPSRQRLAPGPAPAADLFSSAGSGARSVWGRLSSNASSAFTSLQGAYDGLAKDLRAVNVAPPSPDRAAGSSSSAIGGGGELRGRDELGMWGSSSDTERFETPRANEAVRPSTFSATSGFGGNPWATTRAPLPSSQELSANQQRRLPSSLLDDPWGSVKPATTRPSAISPWERMNEGALPADPSVTIVQPTPRRAASTVLTEPPRKEDSPSVHRPADADLDLDPLGVWKS